MGVIIIPIRKDPPRREITEGGIVYREIRSGDDASPRVVGVSILLLVMWMGLVVISAARNWPIWVGFAIIAGPFALFALGLIMSGA